MRHLPKFLIFLIIFVAQKSWSQSFDLDSLWKELAFNKGGCLLGKEYFKGIPRGIDTAVIDTKSWLQFFQTKDSELIDFLQSKLEDTMITKVHVCPYQFATSGELAVYCMQRIAGINWFELRGFEKFENGDSSDYKTSHQYRIQCILSDNKKRSKLGKKLVR